jgi:hypothetical protein
MSYNRLQLAWLTSAENAAAVKGERELIVMTDVWKVRLHDGVTPGGIATLASEAYVQTQIASIAAGTAQNLVLHATCT